jgi:hypothetical protein
LHPLGCHYREILEIPKELSSLNCSFLTPGRYYIDDYEDITRIDETMDIPILGLGDFLYYNLMVLFVLPPLASVTTQIYIGIGCIIFIQIGYMLTNWIAILWNQTEIRPATSLPVVTVSTYTILLHIFMQHLNTDLC